MPLPYRAPFVSERKPKDEFFDKFEKMPRAKMPVRPAEERRNDFREINLGFSEEAARAEAKRCLECGCHDYKDCRLIKYADRYVVDAKRFAGVKHECFKEQRLEIIERDQGKCILCNLCVRVCREDAKQGILGLVGRGFGTVIKPEFRDSATIAVCRECGKCVAACPTGALKLLK